MPFWPAALAPWHVAHFASKARLPICASGESSAGIATSAMGAPWAIPLVSGGVMECVGKAAWGLFIVPQIASPPPTMKKARIASADLLIQIFPFLFILRMADLATSQSTPLAPGSREVETAFQRWRVNQYQQDGLVNIVALTFPRGKVATFLSD